MKQRVIYILALLFATLQTFAQSKVTYQYDENYRLTKVMYANGTTVAYTYDELGNRLSKTVTGASTEPDPPAGDINGDKEVDVGDIMAIINVMAAPPSSPEEGQIYDINGDGQVDVGDIMAIINIMAGL